MSTETKPTRRRKCSATMAFGDDYGDNVTTFRCGLLSGHDGDHEEAGELHCKGYVLAWSKHQKSEVRDA